MQGKTIALIVAGGEGSRMGGEVPKPYRILGGKTVLRRAIEAFLTHPEVDGVRVVIRRADHGLYKKTAEGLTLFPCVVGGATRQTSVQRGLESIARVNPARVLIHDAARPLVSAALISRVIAELRDAPAVLPALPVADTLRRGASLVSREGLWAAQTPQGFDFARILAAHRRFSALQATDDIALAEAAGDAVIIVNGERTNVKLTTAEDWGFMQQLLAGSYDTRIGSGFDVHAFMPPEPDAHIMICGEKIPHAAQLEGHSDADVGLHALVDALLGAISAGDIGQHFPPSDPQWKGADSAQFVRHARMLAAASGAEVINADITIIGEAPKIAPHRAAMAENVASLLGISRSRVNIKATTTEKLGFTGRREGLAAQAVVSVKVPA